MEEIYASLVHFVCAIFSAFGAVILGFYFYSLYQKKSHKEDRKVCLSPDLLSIGAAIWVICLAVSLFFLQEWLTPCYHLLYGVAAFGINHMLETLCVKDKKYLINPFTVVFTVLISTMAFLIVTSNYLSAIFTGYDFLEWLDYKTLLFIIGICGLILVTNLLSNLVHRALQD